MSIYHKPTSICVKTMVAVALMFGLGLQSHRVFAGAMTDITLPDRWINPLLPEKDREPDYPQYDKNNTYEKARLQVWAGQYRRALVTLGSVRKPDAAGIALVRGECQMRLGRYADALVTLDDPDVKQDVNVTILRARLCEAQGEFANAITEIQSAIAVAPASIAAHYYLGWYREQIGDNDGAKAAYEWFNADPQNYLSQWLGHPMSFTSAADVTLIGRALDRWATLNLKYQSDRKMHDVVLSTFVRAYDLIDRDYWPAHLAAAEYFINHDDAPSAKAELGIVLRSNPHCPEAWKLAGLIALGEWDFDGVDGAVERIRQVDRQSIDADLLEARNLLLQRSPQRAMPPLQRVLSKQPRNTEAMGLEAGTFALLLHDDKAASVLKQVDAIDPNDAVAYLEVAEQLAAMRQYPRSAEMYKIAVQRAPWWTAARNGLGLLYTQSGDEDDSRKVLEAAHAMDPFNVSTTNYLRLLDMMDKFARRETAHFIVMYDPKLDPIIPEYFSDYLETIYSEVCGDFGFEPVRKTMIEVFPTHDAFSVRTTGAPWIATVGASTGRVIAMVAPRKGERTWGPFNWAQVLRHEFTHTVTLGQTDNRIAHWFTEGLAVQQEQTPIRWEWVPMLYSAVKKHELFDLDNLTWGFIRPRHPIDRQLAYAESSWICQFIQETYGHAAILKMLELFKAGKSQDEIIAAVFNKSTPDFFEEFDHWCQRQVSHWGYDETTSQHYNVLRAQAEGLIAHHQYVDAVPLFEQMAGLRPVDLLPHQRLAGLYLNKAVHQPEKAVAQLDILASVELKNNMYTKGAARIYRDIGKLDLATSRALKAVYIDPYDADAHKLLADLYRTTGNQPGLERETRVIEELAHWAEAASAPPATQP